MYGNWSEIHAVNISLKVLVEIFFVDQAQPAYRGVIYPQHEGLGCVIAVAPRNMERILTTCNVSTVIGWLNDEAFWNMALISVTSDVSIVIGWLNDEAPLNMQLIVVTFDVSIVIGWLNDKAPENM